MKKLDTLCVHPVDKSELDQGAVAGAIFPSAAYNYLGGDELRYPGFYTTYNQTKLGQILANLEKGSWGMVYSSGMAAISTAILTFVQQGEHVIFSRDLYGGTWKFVEKELPKRNIRFSYAHNTLESFRSQIQDNTRVIYLETPSNPLLKLVPLAEIAAIAKERGIITIVDNTFASPVNQLPLTLGIDISVHSGTKYLGGHNDLPYGALVAMQPAHRDPIFSTAKLYGGSLSPYQCYLAEHALKTLSLRVQKQNENALKLAEFLAKHPKVESVYYPGLPGHPDHALARKQMLGYGGMLSFELGVSPEKLTGFLKSLRIIQPALSLGGVESLICSPAATSHISLSAEERLAIGIKENLLRLSAGIEHIDDLVSDIEQAIEAADK